MRITGGCWRSRALGAPRGTVTRPTSDRVREALFSMLVADGLFDGAPDVSARKAGGAFNEDDGPRVLDLYAGSGALAFEALSRGAVSAVLVELDRAALTAIRANARALGAESRVRVVASNVGRALGQLEGPFDVVFVDPPYADVPTVAFASVLANASRRIAPGGVLVLEHASGDAAPDVPGLALDRSRRHGDTTLTLYRASNQGESARPST